MNRWRAVVRAQFLGFILLAQGNPGWAAPGPVCTLYNQALVAGVPGVAQSMEGLVQVPTLLNQQSQSVLEAVGTQQPNAQQQVDAFYSEGNCGTQMVPLVQEQYNQYIAAGYPTLSYFGLPVTGTVNVRDSFGYPQSYRPGNGVLADFTAVGLLSIGQAIASTIQVVQAAIVAQGSLPAQTNPAP